MPFISKLALAFCVFIIGLSAGTMLSDVRYPLSGSTSSLLSPSDKILVEDIKVFSDRTIIEKENIIWARIKDTHSMEPVLNSNSISLELLPSSPNDISEGDIISFAKNKIIIIHRVIETGFDEIGWFAVTKGDNNQEVDGKVRFDQIKGTVVGILY